MEAVLKDVIVISDDPKEAGDTTAVAVSVVRELGKTFKAEI